LIHDRDSKFCSFFSSIIQSGGLKPLKLTPQSSNLNAFAKRRILSIKSECLSGFIFFSEKYLLKALGECIIHYHQERNHQGKDNRLLFPFPELEIENQNGMINCRSRLGGKLKYYCREAA
jgi:putative transposase